MPRLPTSKLPIGPTRPRIPALMMRVWDAPTRLFHWAIVILIGVSWVSIEQSWMTIHFLSGYTILTLLLFRIAWGIVGSQTARFSSFLKSPLEAIRHLRHFPRREPDTEIGHNAAGGWMILVMLLVLFAQVATGLFSNDDAINEGPLAHLISRDFSNTISAWHGTIFNGILALAALHITAILAYALVKRHDLVRPMITGKKRLPATMLQPRFAHPLLAPLVLAAAAAVVAAIVKLA